MMVAAKDIMSELECLLQTFAIVHLDMHDNV
jgi:hypothetical protein